MNPYHIDLSEANLQGPMISLQLLYDGMPVTSGCEKCAQENGEENAEWCCKSQGPSMYYIEFLAVFREVGMSWGSSKKQELVLRAVRNYLDNSLNKGCIFYNHGCTVYYKRPLSCRFYGVIPEEVWNARWEELKRRQGARFNARAQCSLVSYKEPVTKEMQDKWFEHVVGCEKRIGIPESVILRHDLSGGSYRSFHDHLLLEMFGPDTMAELTQIRLTNPSPEEINLTLDKLRELLAKSNG